MPPQTRTPAESFGAALRAVRDVVFSRGCAGCRRPDDVLCASCRALLHRPVAFDLAGTACGFGVACGLYRGALRQAVLSWKDHGDMECDGPFGDALCALTHAEPMRSALHGVRAVTIVPVPSSMASVRIRGRRQLDPLVRALAQDMRAHGRAAAISAPLRVAHVHGKSVQTSSAQGRRRRVTGHIRMRRRRVADSAPVILVDDIVTSGATMRECVATLQGEGVTVLAALALAYTPPRARETAS